MAICRRDSVPGRPDGSLVPACRYSSPCPAVGPGHYPIWIFSDSRPRAFRDPSPAAPDWAASRSSHPGPCRPAVVALAPDHCRRAVSPDFCGRAFAALRECRRVSVPALTILAVLGFLYGVVGLILPRLVLLFSTLLRFRLIGAGPFRIGTVLGIGRRGSVPVDSDLRDPRSWRSGPVSPFPPRVAPALPWHWPACRCGH